MWVCVCVYAHIHPHCTDEVFGCEPRSRDETPEGPKNPDGLNLGIHIFVYVYKVRMCVYMLGGGMRSWTNCFFLQHFFLPKKKSKKCVRKPPINSNLKYKIRAHRPSIKGTKPLFIVIKVIIIIIIK